MVTENQEYLSTSKAEELYNVGMSFITGDDVEKNAQTGVKILHEAANLGHAGAQCEMGMCFYLGRGVNEDTLKAIEWWQKAAGSGSAKANFKLGQCYAGGECVPKDIQKADEFFCRASRLWMADAECGDAEAQYWIGNCYERGVGVPKDVQKAAGWWKSAAEQGHAWAQCELGSCYERGRGVPMNYRLALEWYDKSISQGIEAANTRKSNFIACTIQWNMDAMSGDADALYRLGLLARDGACEVQDIDKAAELFKMATEAGSIEAKEELQKLDYAFVEELGDEDISKRSDDNFEKGMGSYNMGVCYAQGLGVPQDMTKAVEWWRKAVEQESDANAMFRLGVCYWNGDGVPRDRYKGIELIHKAAEMGIDEAKVALEELNK